ncbi:MAG: hypothetical protein IT329_04295 [Caldilineaceae bacterium]|nr:hypothetical protein [Caldilineaceae bacterium]
MPPARNAAVPLLMRRTDLDRPLAQVLQAAAAELPITVQPVPDALLEDEAAVDPQLETHPGVDEPPAPGTPYAGLTPKQRRRFLEWARTAETPAAPAYRRLYIANLEVRLLEAQRRGQAQRDLLMLAQRPSWRGDVWLPRAVLLGFAVTQEGEHLAEWLAEGRLPPALLGIALGLQARLGIPLTPGSLSAALTAWGLTPTAPEPDLLKLRLTSLTAALGAEPLAYALARSGEAATAPQPWRCAHRSLRPAFPQPDLRSHLEGPLADMLAVADFDPTPAQISDKDASGPSINDAHWQLILEFGHSRSDFFDYVLGRCRQLPDYTQLMDEDRKLVYRVTFRRSDLRRFWQIWDYVQGWSTTHVYLNGDELEKWKVWPYSQYLR